MVMVTVTPMWAPRFCAGGTAWPLVQPLSRTVKPLISPLPCLSLGEAHVGVLRGDVGNAQLNNSPVTPCAGYLRCSR